MEEILLIFDKKGVGVSVLDELYMGLLVNNPKINALLTKSIDAIKVSLNIKVHFRFKVLI